MRWTARALGRHVRVPGGARGEASAGCLTIECWRQPAHPRAKRVAGSNRSCAAAAFQPNKAVAQIERQLLPPTRRYCFQRHPPRHSLRERGEGKRRQRRAGMPRLLRRHPFARSHTGCSGRFRPRFSRKVFPAYSVCARPRRCSSGISRLAGVLQPFRDRSASAAGSRRRLRSRTGPAARRRWSQACRP